MPLMPTRFRMTTTQNGEIHVSSVVISEDEAGEHIAIEEDLHEQAGWEVDREAPLRLYCYRDGVERWIEAREFTPFNDPL